jgi:hypothetical protein
MEQRQLLRVAADDAIDPAGGHAALGQQFLNLEKDIGVHLETAPTLGLQDPKKSSRLHLSDCLIWDLMIRRGLPGTRLQGRNHLPGALNQLRWLRHIIQNNFLHIGHDLLVPAVHAAQLWLKMPFSHQISSISMVRLTQVIKLHLYSPSSSAGIKPVRCGRPSKMGDALANSFYITYKITHIK